jgi:hypothetical protein
MSGGGSIQDMNNRFRDNRALLSRRKLRLKAGKRFFEEKPFMLVKRGKTGNSKNTSQSQLEEIRTKRKKEASYNQVVVISLLLVCLALLTWTLYILLT